jgi:hypothetical protein
LYYCLSSKGEQNWVDFENLLEGNAPVKDPTGQRLAKSIHNGLPVFLKNH